MVQTTNQSLGYALFGVTLVLFAFSNIVFVLQYTESHQTLHVPSENDVQERQPRLLQEEEVEQTSSTSNERYVGQNGYSCIPESTLVDILLSAQQTYIVTQKYAEASLDTFLREHCLTNFHLPEEDNNVFSTPEAMQRLVSNNYIIPPIISSPVENEEAMINLIRGVSDESLIIYVHRQETERLESTIKQIANGLCDNKYVEYAQKVHHNDDGSKCSIDENALLDLVLAEAAKGAAHTFLTCPSWEAMDTSNPNMLFVNHDQLYKIQIELAKRHCPHVLLENGTLPKNITWPMTTMETIQKGTIVIKLNDVAKGEVEVEGWIEKKIHHLHWGFNLKKDTSCQSRVKDMGDETYNCFEGIVQMDPNYEREEDDDLNIATRANAPIVQ